MPTFCRHNRFVERCPICSKTLPGAAPAADPKPRARRATGSASGTRVGRRVRGEGVRVHRESRAVDDGYRCELVPGLRASADGARLAEEIGFSAGRLAALESSPPGLYAEARALAAVDLERASWIVFLIAYLGPLEDSEDPFVVIREVLATTPTLPAEEDLPDLASVEPGPRGSHERSRGAATLLAYRQWVTRTGGEPPTQALAFTGDPAWSPERRFERLFERLALPGFGRTGRYELLLTLGRLGLYELRPDSLHLSGARGASGGEDATILAAKRVFGIGDPVLLDRRATALATATSVPIEVLDLALANWAAPQRARMGCAADTLDVLAEQRARDSLGL
jgi:hypothetical protein